jgi:hypothetical protein
VNENELRDLIERHHQLGRLVQHESWPVFVDYLHMHMSRRQRKVVGGGAKSYDEYKLDCGFLQGLQTALEAERSVGEMVANARGLLDGVQEEEKA